MSWHLLWLTEPFYSAGSGLAFSSLRGGYIGPYRAHSHILYLSLRRRPPRYDCLNDFVMVDAT
jgi:hypothetical protein